MSIRRAMAVVVLATAAVGCGANVVESAPGGSEVVVQVIGDTVVLTPGVVPAGTVRFVVRDAVDKASHGGFAFASRADGSDCPPCDRPPPLQAGDVERLRVDAAPQGIGLDSGWGVGVTLILAPGDYAFMVPGPDGGMPGSPPASITVLTVTE